MPTTASHDGIVSPMASIKNPNTSISVTAHSPIAVIADSEILAQSPFRLLAAGCADLISNFTAIKDWELAHRLKNESFSESAAALSIMSAHLITDNISNIKPNLEPSARIVMKSLFSGGMAISIAGSSRPASGSEHLFSHALDKILDKPALHGEQCGIGTIMMMYLHGGDWKAIRDALKAVQAPTTAAEIGVAEEDIIEALMMAHSIRPERYTILGDNGISKDAAYELAHKTEVI
jgi:glycerol-1-phosphate dehydrogenase [NAD(P)+]